MKDGKIWAIEFNDGKKWCMISTYYVKRHAIDSIKCHYLRVNGEIKNYRVVKYVRQEKDDGVFDPVCRKCGDPLVTYELTCDGCRDKTHLSRPR